MWVEYDYSNDNCSNCCNQNCSRGHVLDCFSKGVEAGTGHVNNSFNDCIEDFQNQNGDDYH